VEHINKKVCCENGDEHVLSYKMYGIS